MFDTLVIFQKYFFFENPNFEIKNQQPTKHDKNDKLLIRQRVNEFIEKQHILFRLAIEKYMFFNEGRYYFLAKHLLVVFSSFGTF